ncbi:hypothetical protein DM01DRAFT_1332803 [Hesseltinella vesiculosa]|uniref:Uncharacterized protein n=1 Tax=Hesseltinella vesiculosa TaxID=101127 RepID=A0A1X2GT73_9FUNG|nr:hypothetical protein DM01DRAFT_1332803 [Hesseltinella vesiculosa]
MSNTAHEVTFDLSHSNVNTVTGQPMEDHDTPVSYRSALLSKVKDGLFRLVGKRHTSLVHSLRPKRTNPPPTQLDDPDNAPVDQTSLSSPLPSQPLYDRPIEELRHLHKDNDVERSRYERKQHVRRASLASLQASGSPLIPKKLTRHRHTGSLQHYTSSSPAPPQPILNPHFNPSNNASILTTSSASSISGGPASLQPLQPSGHRPSHYGHTRHYSQLSSSNITVNSEDLTAKEFADMAGIRILAETDDMDDQEDTHTSSISPLTQHAATLPYPRHPHPSFHPASSSSSSSVTTPNQDDIHHWSVLSTSSLHSQQSVRIWDQNFWRRPSFDEAKPPLPPSLSPSTLPPPLPTSTSSCGLLNTNHLLPPLPEPSNGRVPLRKHRSALFQHRATLSLPPPLPAPSKVKTQHTKSKSTTTCELPIVHELRRIQSMSADKKEKTDQQVLRKGRFEIQLRSATS